MGRSSSARRRIGSCGGGRAESTPLGWGQLRDLGLAIAAAGAALVVNPNGIGLYGYPLYTLGITSLGRYVMEWFPASLGDLFGQMLAAFVVVGVLPTLIFGRHRLRTADALVLVGLCVMAWRAIRFLLIVGPIGGAIVAVVLAPVISQTSFGRRLDPILAGSPPRRSGVAVGCISRWPGCWWPWG